MKRLAALLLCVLAGGAGALSSQASKEATTDPKLSLTTYVEEGQIAALIVSTRPTRYRLDRAYLPFEVAFANKGLPSITLTRESFTLIGPDGREYPLAGRDELA